jgi:hypothetical protein
MDVPCACSLQKIAGSLFGEGEKQFTAFKDYTKNGKKI